MKLKRRFSDSSLNFRNLSKNDLLLAIVIGLGAAFTIYSFFYVVRESFRVISFGFMNIPNIVLESNRDFYNLFFAGLSMIFGNSIAISFLLSKPQNVFSRNNTKRNRILNDQIFLNLNFAYWFGKMGLLFGAGSMSLFDFPYRPYFYFPLLLLLVVMYLETWKTWIQVLGLKGYKWMLIHFLILLSLSFAMSKVDVVNYKAIDAVSLEMNPKVDLPQSYFSETIGNFDRLINFRLLLDKHDNLIIIDAHMNRVKINELQNVLNSEKTSRREEHVPFLKVGLSIDKALEMRHVVGFLNVLNEADFCMVVYFVKNEDMASERFVSKGLPVRHCIPYFYKDELTTPITTPKPHSVLDNPLEYFNDYYASKNKLIIDIDDQIKVDGIIVPKDLLVEKLKISINENTLFEYNYTMQTSFQNYLTVLSAHFMAAKSIRKDHQTLESELDFYNKNYEAYKAEQEQLKTEFPIAKMERIR